MDLSGQAEYHINMENYAFCLEGITNLEHKEGDEDTASDSLEGFACWLC